MRVYVTVLQITVVNGYAFDVYMPFLVMMDILRKKRGDSCKTWVGEHLDKDEAEFQLLSLLFRQHGGTETLPQSKQ